MKRINSRIASLLLAGSLLFLPAWCQAEEAPPPAPETMESVAPEAEYAHVIEKKTMPIHFGDMEEADKDDIDLFFIDGVADVPYISVETARNLLVYIARLTAPGYDLTMEKAGERVTLRRETHYPVTFDCRADTITFWDFDAFISQNPKATLMDAIGISGFNDNGEAELFQRSDTSFERYGDAITFRPGDYGIDMFCQDGTHYLPLQLFSDIFLSFYNLNTLFNGEAVFVPVSGNVEPFEEAYYRVPPPEERSEALASFTYNEICFALDALYGLKEQHNIRKFDTMLLQSGLKAPLLSLDPQEAGQALSDLTFMYLDDQHSGLLHRSYRMKEEPKRRLGTSFRQSRVDRKRYADARKKYYPDVVPGYEEVGNTAYITFDSFVYEGIDYYTEKAEDHLTDTMGLMIHAFSRITRPGSPVENVVLDLSNNTGGTSTSAAYTIGMFLGEGSISLANPLTGALVTQDYKTDLNLDRKFDERDNLLKYNLFCLTSPNSFSCGNLVPSVLKNSHRVTILGQTSGGGACIVQHMTSADGCVFCLSGPYRMSYTKNGSFYDIDRGVTPDFVLPSPEQFYNRKQLTKTINGLLGK